jgi:hypothetical protein
MFVIIDNDSDDPHNQILALNLDSADQIAIRYMKGLFTLVFEKVMEAGTRHVIMANFKTSQQAIDCFIQMMDALEQGNQVWIAPKAVAE